MLELYIALLLISITILFFFTRKDKDLSEEENKNKQKENQKENLKGKKPQNQNQKNEVKEKENQEDEDSYDKKTCLVNTFRETKDMKNLRFLDDDKTIVFSDEKRIVIGNFPNFSDKNFNFYSKTLDGDTIADLVYSKGNK
jgi:hypothetical protein